MAVVPAGFAVVPGGGNALINYVQGAVDYLRGLDDPLAHAAADYFGSTATGYTVGASSGIPYGQYIGAAGGAAGAAFRAITGSGYERFNLTNSTNSSNSSVPLLMYNSTPADPLIDPRPGGGHVYMNFMGNRGAGRRGIVRFVRHRGRRQFSHRFRDNYGQYDSRARDGFPPRMGRGFRSSAYLSGSRWPHIYRIGLGKFNGPRVGLKMGPGRFKRRRVVRIGPVTRFYRR